MRGLAVKARGRLSGGTPARLDLANLTAEGRGRRIALAHPATLAYGDGGLDIQNFALVLDTGRLTVAGHAGAKLDLKVAATAIPLSLADIVAPGLGLSGVADGEATIGGSMGAPVGDWRLRLARVSAPQLRERGPAGARRGGFRASSAAGAPRSISRSTPARAMASA